MPTKDFLLCLGASGECAGLILDALNENFHVIALGLDEEQCLQEILGAPAFYQNAALRDNTVIISLSPEEILALHNKEQGYQLLARKVIAQLKESPKVNSTNHSFECYQYLDPNSKDYPAPNLSALKQSAQEFFNCQDISYEHSQELLRELKLVVLSHVNLIDDELNEHIARIFAIKGILPSPIGFMIKHVGKLNDKLHTAGISEHCALTFADKKRVYELLRAQGANCAEQLCLSEDEVLSSERLALIAPLSSQVGYPLIVKPRFGSGSRHVTVVNNEQELEQALAKIASLITNKRITGQDLFVYDMLVERYIKHEIELTVNGIIKDGKIIVALALDKIVMSALPYRQEVAYSTNLLPDFMRQAVIAELEKVAAALQIDNSAIMSDMIIELDDPYSNLPTSQRGQYDPCALEDSFSKRHSYDDYRDIKVYAVDTAGRHTGYYLHSTFAAANHSLIPYFLKYVIAQQDGGFKEMDAVNNSLREHNYVQHFFTLQIGTISSVPSKEYLLELIAKTLGYQGAQKRSCALEHIAYFKCLLSPGMVITTKILSNGALTSLGYIVLKDVPERQAIAINEAFSQAIVYQS